MGEAKNRSDKLEAAEATKLRVLIREDIRKYEQTIAQHEAQIATLRVYIAESYTMLADIDRREAGVLYPKAPEAKKTPEGQDGGQPAPAMGEIVGGPAPEAK